jgi:hypothetical protein
MGGCVDGRSTKEDRWKKIIPAISSERLYHEAHDAELPRANAFFTASFWPL